MSPTRGCCTSTSTGRASRTTARAVRTLADSVLGRALLRLLALAERRLRTRRSLRAVLRRRRCSTAAAAPSRRPSGSACRARPGSSRGSTNGEPRLDGVRRDARHRGLGASANGRAPRRSRDVRRRRSPPSSTPHRRRATWAGSRVPRIASSRRFFGSDQRGEASGRHRTGSGAPRRSGRSTGWAGSTRSTMPRRSTCSGARSSSSSTAARDHVGRLGEGVLAGPVGLALGVELDRVWVCGLAEGVFPSVPRDDPLLADADEPRSAASCRLRADRVDDAERALLAALASTSGARVCTWPRGDLRRSTEHVPSRFLVGDARTVGPIAVTIASYAQRPGRDRGVPGDAHELGVRAALASRTVGRRRARGGAGPRARRGACECPVHALRRQPRRAAATRCGRSARSTPTARSRRRARAVGRLPARVPHAVRAARRAIEQPEEIMQLSPLDRGSIVHDVLDTFVRRTGATTSIGPASASWPRSGVRGGRSARHHRPAAAVGARPPSDARRARRVLRRRRALAAPSAVPRRSPTELPFGFAGSPTPRSSSSGPTAAACSCAGKADRVDRAADGTPRRHRLQDGQARFVQRARPRRIRSTAACTSAASDLRARGPQLAFGRRRGVEAYVLVRRPRRTTARSATRSTPMIDAAFMGAVRTIVDGIEAGVFVRDPARARPASWVRVPTYCDPDGLGTRRPSGGEWERKYRREPELAGLPRPTAKTPTRDMTEQLAARSSRPGDGAARDRDPHRSSTTTLFVEAGAGTGKTDGARRPGRRARHRPARPVPMRAIAAITFTEKAAAELRDRVRARRCERRRGRGCERARRTRRAPRSARCTRSRSGSSPSSRSRPGCRRASRCATRSRRASRSKRGGATFVDELLDDPELEQSMLLMLAAGRAARPPARGRRSPRRQLGPARPDRRTAAAPALDLDRVARRARRRRARRADDCRADDDKLLVRLAEFARVRASGCAPRSTTSSGCGCCSRPSRRSTSGGSAGRRTGPTSTTSATRDRPRSASSATRWSTRCSTPRSGASSSRARARHARAVAERRAAGELEFHDLLVLARTLLRDPSTGVRARARLRERYQRLLIDEFQDTDPIQVELAALLGSADADAGGARPGPRSTVEPGRLFFVGDPKQSIYRFRRADIATFLAAARPLRRRTRCTSRATSAPRPSVLAWINHVFARADPADPGSQPEYRAARRPLRRRAPATGRHAARRRRRTTTDPTPTTLRGAEAADVAATVAAPRSPSSWPVDDRATGRVARRAARRHLHPAAGAHVARLPRARARRRRRVRTAPRRARSCTARREVRDLLATLRAVDDPSDELALVDARCGRRCSAAATTTCSTYHVEHKRPVGHPRAAAGVAAGRRIRSPTRCGSSASCTTQRQWVDAERAARAASCASGTCSRSARVRRRFRDVARRVRFVVDQARAFGDAAGGALRDYLAWADAAGHRRRAGGRGRAARDRRRRRAHPHDPRRQGPRVPDRHLLGHDHRRARRAARGVQVLFPPAGGYEVR